jgi:S-adenosylmethionine synthetase
MAGNAACGKTGKFGIGHPDRIADVFHQRTETRAEDDGDTRHQAVQALHQNIDQHIRHQGSSVLKLKGKSSSMVMTFCTPVSSQR